VKALFDAGIDVHCLRDCTRGGLSSALNEIAQTRGLSMRVEEAEIPVEPVVRGACEILGLDPLYVANEGRFVAFVPQSQASRAIEVLRSVSASASTVRIGNVLEDSRGLVTLRSRIGGNRVLDMLSGEQLPRIC
jgi:hydrogenase expression/formation protein HypE